jgi:hypothetical protein
MTILEKNMLKTVKAYIEAEEEGMIVPLIDLTEWEYNFINSLKEDWDISRKQYQCLKKIHEKF